MTTGSNGHPCRFSPPNMDEEQEGQQGGGASPNHAEMRSNNPGNSRPKSEKRDNMSSAWTSGWINFLKDQKSKKEMKEL